MSELRIADITKREGGRFSFSTTFVEAWELFEEHHPPSNVYEGAENFTPWMVIEVKMPSSTQRRVKASTTRRLEVWHKGGDWNENPFFYFCIGVPGERGELYYIPQLSPTYPVLSPAVVEEIQELHCRMCSFDNTATTYLFCPMCGEALLKKVEKKPEELGEEEFVEVDFDDSACILRFVRERFLDAQGNVSSIFFPHSVD